MTRNRNPTSPDQASSACLSADAVPRRITKRELSCKATRALCGPRGVGRAAAENAHNAHGRLAIERLAALPSGPPDIILLPSTSPAPPSPTSVHPPSRPTPAIRAHPMGSPADPLQFRDFWIKPSSVSLCVGPARLATGVAHRLTERPPVGRSCGYAPKCGGGTMVADDIGAQTRKGLPASGQQA